MAGDRDLFGEALKRSATPAFTPAPSAAAPSGVPAAGAPTPTAGAGGTPLGRFLEGQIAEYTRLGQEGPVSRFFGGNARMDAIRQAVPGLAEAATREQTAGPTIEHLSAQTAALQQGVLKSALEMADMLGSFGLNEEQIEKVIPLLANGLRFGTGGGAIAIPGANGAPGTKENFDLGAMLRPILKGEAVGGRLIGLMEDFTPGEMAAVAKASRGDKTGKAALEAIDKINGIKDKQGTEELLNLLTGLPASQQPRAFADVAKELRLNPRGQRLLGAMKADDLQRFGIMAKTPDILEAEAKAQASGRRAGNPEHLGFDFNRYAAQLFPGRDPATLTQDEAASVNAALEEAKGRVSALQGSAGVTAKAASERSLPLVQSLKPDEHIIDVQTGQPADRFTTSLEDIQKAGGTKRYAHLNDKQFQQYQGIQESHAIVKAYEDVVNQLTKQPGANFGQALTFYAKTKLGVENPGVALEALHGSVLRLAGAFQGSRAQLSDKDVAAIKGMLPTSTDTMQTAKQRLTVVTGLLDVMKNVALGRASTDGLRDRLNALPQPKAPTITGIKPVPGKK